jgi:hypothetical protein
MALTRSCTPALAALAALALGAAPAAADELPPWLPHYDLDIRLDVAEHKAVVHQRVTWTNRHARPAAEVVFNAHSSYKIPDKDIGFLAKMLELLRLAPSEGLDFDGPAFRLERAAVIQIARPGAPPEVGCLPVETHFQKDNATALVVPLPRPVAQGESVILDLEFVMHLPPKQGRWGQWKGVTFLAQWLPVLAYYDDHGWQPTPFVPWHQPFFNEAGLYSARVTLPCGQVLGSTGPVMSVHDLGDGWQQVDLAPCCARDFALFCSDRFKEYIDHAGPVRVRCLAFPEHEWYAREMLRVACQAICAYSEWFGPYPFPEFTLVESYFGWNGNECGNLVMIDARIFAMPHLALNFIEQLVSHEVCHQWWYNVVGTNGYCETWMDEGLATYLSHRLMDEKQAPHNNLLRYPAGLEWLPNIRRDDYRHYTLMGTIGRGEACKTVQDMPGFGHLVTINSMAYDKGSKIVGMIEERLGHHFLDFMRRVYARYQFRILRVADFQRELEEYTGYSWEQFFHDWLYGAGLCDWCVEKVTVHKDAAAPPPGTPLDAGHGPPSKACIVTVLLHQKAQINEATTLGFCLDGGEGYQIRIPINPQLPLLELDDPPARVECLTDNRVRVEAVLPCPPTQIAVDPDQLLVDPHPANNYWKPRFRFRITPLYTLLDDTDLTCAYDRWNITFGPWVYGSAYHDPWYTRSAMFGLRAGLYRTQEFSGGAYLAYRTDDGNVVAGLDGLWDHCPWPHTQIGFNLERSLTTNDDRIGGDGVPEQHHCNRGVVFGRYIFLYGDSLYLPPAHYVEVFGAVQDHCLPLPERRVVGAERFDDQTLAGVHYHLDYLTPYWDPEGGFKVDATYATGIPIFGEKDPFNEVNAQFSTVKSVPDWFGLGHNRYLAWLFETRVAARIYGAIGLPNRGEYFTLGGGELFRGFDLAERQGNAVWVGSLEWRVPLVRDLAFDCCDHVAGLRNIYGALFYDVGDAYTRNQSLGPVAHAVGAGLRLDVAWFGMIERTTVRLDFAKTVNESTPVQFWFGVQHPF